MLKIIRKLLLKLIDDIDADNTHITEEEALILINNIKVLTDNNKLYNRTQAAKYLNCSVQTFDLYRKEGKIAEGVKEAGGVRQWTKKQLDDLIKRCKDDN